MNVTDQQLRDWRAMAQAATPKTNGPIMVTYDLDKTEATVTVRVPAALIAGTIALADEVELLRRENAHAEDNQSNPVSDLAYGERRPVVNGRVYCDCGEPAVDSIETADGVKFYCADHLAKSKAKINADIVRDLAAIMAIELLVSVGLRAAR